MKQKFTRTKNVAIVVACLAISVVFISCKKEPIVENSKKKMSQIYEQRGSGSKQLLSAWTWNNDLVSKIDYGDFSDVFEYDGKRISRIITNYGDGGKVMNYYYDGYNLDRIERIDYGNEWYGVYKFTYNGSKVNKMEISITTDFENLDEERIMITIYFTWQGDNIIKEEYEFIDIDGTKESFSCEYKEYDQKENPFYGLIYDPIEDGYGIVWNGLSKNNPKKVVYIYDDGDFEEMDFVYKYDGDLPIECKRIEKYQNQTYTTTKYYEYK